MTDVDVHPLAPPELHQAAEPHAGVPEPPGRVQHHAHGLSALEQQLGSPGSIGAPGPVQPALQRDRAAEGVPVRRGRPASVADVTVQVIKAVPWEGQPLGAGELCPASQKRLFFLRLPAQPLPLRPRACGETGRSALRNPIPRGATQARRAGRRDRRRGGCFEPPAGTAPGGSGMMVLPLQLIRVGDWGHPSWGPECGALSWGNPGRVLPAPGGKQGARTRDRRKGGPFRG